MRKTVKFNDTMQKGQYELTEEPGKTSIPNLNRNFLQKNF